jgi:hypothetical protein
MLIDYRTAPHPVVLKVVEFRVADLVQDGSALDDSEERAWMALTKNRKRASVSLDDDAMSPMPG